MLVRELLSKKQNTSQKYIFAVLLNTVVKMVNILEILFGDSLIKLSETTDAGQSETFATRTMWKRRVTFYMMTQQKLVQQNQF